MIEWRTWTSTGVEHAFIDDRTRPACGHYHPRAGWGDEKAERQCAVCIKALERTKRIRGG